MTLSRAEILHLQDQSILEETFSSDTRKGYFSSPFFSWQTRATGPGPQPWLL